MYRHGKSRLLFRINGFPVINYVFILYSGTTVAFLSIISIFKIFRLIYSSAFYHFPTRHRRSGHKPSPPAPHCILANPALLLLQSLFFPFQLPDNLPDRHLHKLLRLIAIFSLKPPKNNAFLPTSKQNMCTICPLYHNPHLSSSLFSSNNSQQQYLYNL